MVIGYLLFINVLTFILYGIDKQKAKKGKWRISEGNLLGLALLGGSIGAWYGMKTFRHKTQHKKFIWGIPIILCTQLILIILLWITTTK